MDEIVRNLTIDASFDRYGLVVVASVFGGITDVIRYRISNAVTLPLIFSGVLYHIVFSEKGALFTLFGGLTGFSMLILFFAAGGVGAGDVKLLTGIGAWIGAHDVLVVFIVAGLLVGACSLAMILWTTKWSELPGRAASICRQFLRRRVAPLDTVEEVARVDEPTRRRRLVPMGTMIAVALVILIARDLLETDRPATPPRAAQDTGIPACMA